MKRKMAETRDRSPCMRRRRTAARTMLPWVNSGMSAKCDGGEINPHCNGHVRALRRSTA